MGYYIKSVVEIIESNYDNFTDVEKNIADFFIHNNKKQKFSSKDLADKLFVSQASLSRFSQKCGFRGYREFIYQYLEDFVEKEQDVTGNISQVLNTYQELLNKTYSLVDENQIKRIINYLNTVEKVFVCGKGSSGLAANEMELRFMRIGVNIDSITDSDQMKMRSIFHNENSLAIGLSISGNTEEVLYYLFEAHKKNAKTVLITSQNKKAYKNYCDEVILVPSLIHLNHGNVISPQFPISVMVDLIYSYFVKEDKNKKEKLHDDTLRALNIKIEKEENDL
ncbi:MurR/RpiR family transcriptional regulator [Anaerococcus sp. AGMB00486]|uniref:MurR/RpiR family transcriptional regulator n=2 Tax=Anaerococcus TaxID=165779 RepID=A0ABX2NC62_9FIRM|nr:MurR/RpiR family transcriptional regulator [Anaerococcus porci]NVF12278.1 MurR/RpiR family transcriptional regulator [Anaerococcus faecalis]